MDKTKALKALQDIPVATLGHFTDEGFCNPRLKPVNPKMKIVGTVKTLKVFDGDAIAINRGILRLNKGDVFVIDMGENDPHACIGTVTRAAIKSTGAIGVIVNGLVTDINDLADINNDYVSLPIFALGISGRTTKLHDLSKEIHGGEINIAGVIVNEGDIVVADGDGVFFGSLPLLSKIIPLAQESEKKEPEILKAIQEGVLLENILNLGS